MNAAIPAVIAALGLNEAACLDAIEGADAYANNACLPLYSELLLSAPPVVAVEARSVFGNTLIYPANKEAQYLAVIAGKKTLSRADLDNAIAMGLKVVEVSAAKILNLAA